LNSLARSIIRCCFRMSLCWSKSLNNIRLELKSLHPQNQPLPASNHLTLTLSPSHINQLFKFF
jgi:hypothetical protein